MRSLIKNLQNQQQQKNGFTVIEVIVGLAIFAILLTGVISAYSALAKSVKAAREKVVLASLSSNYLEIVRNMPYADIGTISGNPPGNLPSQTNPTNQTIEGKTYHIYYDIIYIHDPADPLPGNPDYKQVKLVIINTLTGVASSFITTVAPQGPANPNVGSILVSVINAQGQPVNGANVQISNDVVNPNLMVNRQSDASGNWLEPGLLPSVNTYHIVATKAGYSTDQTYPITAQNPNPINPDATVAIGQVTHVTLVIDLLSTLVVRTLDQFCQPVAGVGVNVRGAKLIGTNPNVLKYSENFTSDSTGTITINNLEWDTYIPTLLTGQSVMVYGTSPVQQITVLPGATQLFTLILGPYTTNSLLVIVKDAATGAVLENANVHLEKGGSIPQDYYAITGGSVWEQASWTGGGGQDNFGDDTRYLTDDGNVDINSVPTGLRLLKISSHYVPSGTLESSTFDTGASSNFTTLTWEPTSQSADTVLKFQVATNNDNATWDYKGPDGSATSYYMVSGNSINSVHDGDRYIRYKVFVSTADDRKTPVLTSLNMNYVSGCNTPGQVMFPGLTEGNNYFIDVSLSGYQTQTINTFTIDGNAVMEIIMSQ